MGFEQEARALARTGTLAEFVARFGHPFLAVSIGDAIEGPASFDTDPVVTGQGTALHRDVLAAVAKRSAANQFSFITIGRAKNNDVVVDAHGVSKLHAVIHQRGDTFAIADAGSRNGTFLNGERLHANRPIALASGDELALSKHVRARFLDVAATREWLRATR